MCESNCVDLSHDLLTIRGIGVFTVFRARGDVPFHFQDHWDRIVNSCKGARIPTLQLPYMGDALEMVKRALCENAYDEAMVRVIVTAGDSIDGKHVSGAPKLLVIVDPMPTANQNPLRLALQCGGRRCPEIKMVGPYADLMLDLAKAEEEHCQDILYFCDDNTMLLSMSETTCGNIFFVTKDNMLVTPAKQILAGVTRSIVLDIADKSKIFERVEVRNLSAYRTLSYCVEVFRTASISGVVPIRSIGDYQFRVGAGTRTEKVRKLYEDYINEYFTKSGA